MHKSRIGFNLHFKNFLFVFNPRRHYKRSGKARGKNDDKKGKKKKFLTDSECSYAHLKVNVT